MNIFKCFQNFFHVLERHANQKFVYVAMGDSTVEGIGTSSSDKTVPSIIHKSLLQTHKNAKVYNLGIGGSKTKDVIKKQLDKAIALDPNLVTLSIGANDVMYGKALFVFKKELKFLLNELRMRTNAQIVINNIPDFSGAISIPNPLRFIHSLRAKSFNKAIQEICEELGIIHVDIYSQTKLLSKYEEFISSDRLHPSDRGYDLWASIIIARLRNLAISPYSSAFQILRRTSG